MSTAFLEAKYGGSIDRARTPAPVSNEGLVSDAWRQLIGLSDIDRIAVTEANVRGLPALDRAVEMVSNSVASMMAEATREAPEAVLRRPHPIYGAHEFWKLAISTTMMRGNFVSIVVGNGGDQQLVPVAPDGVSIDQSSGLPVYLIQKRRYQWNEVIHLRANALPGSFWGRGIVEKHRVALAAQLYAAKWLESSFSSGGMPSGVVTIDQSGPVTQDQTDAVDESWQAKFAKGQRKVAVLPRGLSFAPVSWTPQDAEFAESRRIGVAEAALMASLKPEDLGSSFGGSGLTYANRSDDSLQRLTDSYQPWAEVLEGPLSDLVGRDITADPQALMRMSLKEQEELEALRLDNEIKRRSLSAPEPTPDPAEVTQ